MKRLLLIVSICMSILFFSTQSVNGQKLTRQEMDTIENRVRNQFKLAVDAAVNNNVRNYFTSDAMARANGTRYISSTDVDNVAIPALKYYIDNTIQVVHNLIDVKDKRYTEQSVEIITLKTDTSGGISIDGVNPEYKHMVLQLSWSKLDDSWKISYFDRELSR